MHCCVRVGEFMLDPYYPFRRRYCCVITGSSYLLSPLRSYLCTCWQLHPSPVPQREVGVLRELIHSRQSLQNNRRIRSNIQHVINAKEAR
ncbi:hypothetical protein HanIR_Chr10g0492351 [Helianthus annuus]|nr:hypothetical protein HanIR_Chr10g0492351 [Helianthus annuus]